MLKTEFLIVGGGILGLTSARGLLAQGASDIVILEKEAGLGMHASGRNSGVLHAGLYYPPDSLKSRFCISGAQQMKAYAADNHIPCLPLGKVMLATDALETERLEALYKRAQANGVPVERLTPAQLKEHEPEARTHDWALLSPSTSVINPRSVLEHLKNDLLATGKCRILFSEALLTVSPESRTATTTHETIQYAHLINVAGLFADRVAHQMGVGKDYELLPFRGAYLKVRADYAAHIRGLIYPVPDPALPFLGVHFTRSAEGEVYVGPTAAPALGRENYQGLQGLNISDSGRIFQFLSTMLWRNTNGLRQHVKEELQKQWPGGIWRAAKKLAPTLKAEHLLPSAKVGIRAQLIHREKKTFIQDFVIEKAPHSTHVLNAVSPGFTASFAFGAHIASVAMNT